MISVEQLKQIFSEKNIESLRKICAENDFEDLLIIPPQEDADSNTINMAYTMKEGKPQLSFSAQFDLTIELASLFKLNYVSFYSHDGMIDFAVDNGKDVQKLMWRLLSGISFDDLDPNRSLPEQWEEKQELMGKSSAYSDLMAIILRTEEQTINPPDNQIDPPQKKVAGYSPRFNLSVLTSTEDTAMPTNKLVELTISPVAEVH